MIADRTEALHDLARRYFGAAATSAPKLTVVPAVSAADQKTPSRHDALVRYGVESVKHGLSGAALLEALSAKNGTYEEPKPSDEIRSIARWCEREIESIDQRSLSCIDAVDLLSRPFEPPRFLARHIIPTKALVLFSGDSGAAKTALLLNAAISMATGAPVAGRFDVETPARILYVNGEMSDDTLARYLQEAAAGLGATIPSGRLFFEGCDGVATWRFGENPTALAALVAEMRPDLVILDTLRALLIEDESDTAEVRRVFSWIREQIVNAYGATVVIAHHLRKLGPVSNSSRERVAGSRDLIGAVDLHLAAKARDGAPLNALRLDKTRTPVDGIAQGTEWPVEARLEPGAPNRSIFIANAPQSPEKAAAASASAEDAAVDEIRALLEAEGARTIDELEVKGGARKRAWERLRKTEVVEAGKRGRKTLYALRDAVPDQEELL